MITGAPPQLGDAVGNNRGFHMDSVAPYASANDVIDAELDALEAEMPNIQARAGNVFVLAGTWAERHDAIVAATPQDSLGAVEARLRRIGIRWGMMHGARVTAQFPALPPAASDDKV